MCYNLPSIFCTLVTSLPTPRGLYVGRRRSELFLGITMDQFQITFFGNENSGKTQLVKRLVNKQKYVFDEQLLPTKGANIHSILNDDGRYLTLLDVSGEKKNEALLPMYITDACIGVYCVDLSQAINKKQINDKIRKFQNNNFHAPLILVGTKSDLLSSNELAQKIDDFKTIEIPGVLPERFITSAKHNDGIEDLLTCIKNLCFAKENHEHIPEDSQWNEVKARLLVTIKTLPGKKLEKIKNYLEVLEQSLQECTDVESRAKAINDFSTNCHALLEGKHPKVFNTVLTVIAVAAITIVAAIIGFGIGFGLGLWTGPGAFFTGLIGGSFAAFQLAGTVAAVGIFRGSLIAHGLFKEPKGIWEVDEFVNSARNLFDCPVKDN